MLTRGWLIEPSRTGQPGTGYALALVNNSALDDRKADSSCPLLFVPHSWRATSKPRPVPATLVGEPSSGLVAISQIKVSLSPCQLPLPDQTWVFPPVLNLKNPNKAQNSTDHRTSVHPSEFRAPATIPCTLKRAESWLTLVSALSARRLMSSPKHKI